MNKHIELQKATENDLESVSDNDSKDDFGPVDLNSEEVDSLSFLNSKYNSGDSGVRIIPWGPYYKSDC